MEKIQKFNATFRNAAIDALKVFFHKRGNDENDGNYERNKDSFAHPKITKDPPGEGRSSCYTL